MRLDIILDFLLLPLLLMLPTLGFPASTTHGRSRSVTESALERRTAPFFPDQPPSCPICAKDYSSISGCAEAAPVLQNFTTIIFNPSAFIDVIKCACVDTFESVFPQCVDCFLQTGQEDVLNTPNLPAVVDGMRKVCAVASTLLGNVSAVDGESTPSTSAPVPSPTGSGVNEIKVSIGLILASLGVGMGSLFL